MAEAKERLVGYLDQLGADYERQGDDHLVVTLPGIAKQQTICHLIVGDHALRIEAFVMRHPDENHQQLYEYVLRANARMYAVAFSIDAAGDVFLAGRVALDSLSLEELDRLLGSVAQYADSTFNQLLTIGFPSAIRREWAWRESRGESLANLAAFADWAQVPGQQ